MSKSVKAGVPGAGTYELGTKVGEGPQFIMGAKCGVSAIEKSGNQPGPGAYTPADRTYDGVQYSMGTKTQPPTTILIKADGTHEQLSNPKKFAPGPGAYNAKPVYPRVHTGARIGTEGRKGMANNNNVPGPNTYRERSKDTVLRQAPSFGFGSSKRPQSQYTRMNNPGPGSYQIKGIVGTES